MQFHEHLKIIRTTANKTQQELATYLNVSTQSVSKWENGLSLPSTEYLPKIAKFFDCCVETFFNEEILNHYKKYKSTSTSTLSLANCTVFEKTKPTDGDTLQPSTVFDAELATAVYDCLRKSKDCSVAKLQRTLKIGYIKAGHIMDILRDMGIVDATITPSEKGYGNIYKDKIDLLLPYCK